MTDSRPSAPAIPAINDDLRDRLVAISAAIADQDDRAAQAMLREILKAAQPAPSVAAAKQSAACDKAPAGWLCIRQHGHDSPCAAEPTLSARSDEWIEGYAAGVRDGRADALRAPQPSPTPQADSVLEDAARLDWLALAGPTSICLVIDRPHDGEVEVATDDVTGYGKTLREAIDAAMNKGGA